MTVRYVTIAANKDNHFSVKIMVNILIMPDLLLFRNKNIVLKFEIPQFVWDTWVSRQLKY